MLRDRIQIVLRTHSEVGGSVGGEVLCLLHGALSPWPAARSRALPRVHGIRCVLREGLRHHTAAIRYSHGHVDLSWLSSAHSVVSPEGAQPGQAGQQRCLPGRVLHHGPQAGTAVLLRVALAVRGHFMLTVFEFIVVGFSVDVGSGRLPKSCSEILVLASVVLIFSCSTLGTR